MSQTTDKTKEVTRKMPNLNGALKMIERGSNVRHAMIENGYNHNTAKTGMAGRPKAVMDKILKAKEVYESKFIKKALKSGGSGDQIAVRLLMSVHGKDDFNSTNAIKEYNRVMLRSNDKSAVTINQGIFLVPGSTRDQTWEEEVDKAKAIIVNPLEKNHSKPSNGE